MGDQPMYVKDGGLQKIWFTGSLGVTGGGRWVFGSMDKQQENLRSVEAPMDSTTFICPDITLWKFKQGSTWNNASITFTEKCSPYCAHKRNEIKNALQLAVDLQEKSDEKAAEKQQAHLYVLEETKQILDLMQKTGQNLRENTDNPATIRNKIHKRIDDEAKTHGWSDQKRDDMKKAVTNAIDFDPLWTTSYQAIIASTETNIQREIYLPKKKVCYCNLKQLLALIW